MQSKEEQLLIDACKRDEQWAYREIYNRFAPAMLSLCLRYLGDMECAKDALQDGFINLFRNIDSFQNRSGFAAWVRTIFVNCALAEIKRNKNMDSYDLEIDNSSISDSVNYEHILERINADDIHQYISQLPDKWRTVFNLVAVEGYTHIEVSALLNIPVETSRTYYHRGRNMLKKKLKNWDK